MYLAIDKYGVGQYVEADDFEAAEAICACNDLKLVGEVIIILEAPGVN
jgi:hypothetical protein